LHFSFDFIDIQSSISTLNIRGFGPKTKQFCFFFFYFARKSRSDFFCLHGILAATESSICNFILQWFGPRYWSAALEKQPRVAVLVKENYLSVIVNWILQAEFLI